MYYGWREFLAAMQNMDSKELGRAVAWASDSESQARCRISPLLVWLYRFRLARRWVLSACTRLEGGRQRASMGRFFSETWRTILKRYHGVSVGKYSYGPCLTPGQLPPGTSVGNYCSIAEGLAVYRVNHPIERLSQHPFFLSADLGLLSRNAFDSIDHLALQIGHDVWIGHNVVILPRCRRIGDGAVIGAGSVVTRDVPAFTVVAGNPARVIRRRFSEEIEKELVRLQWWLLPLPAAARVLPAFLEPVDETVVGMLRAATVDAQEAVR